MNSLRFVVVAAAVVVIMLLFGVAAFAVAPVTTAPVAQVALPRSISLYGPTSVTTGTTYSSAPLTVQNQDMARISNYTDGVFFVETGANSTGSVTVTVQASPDGATWVDSVEIIHTFSATGTLTSNTYSYSKALSGASAVGMIRAPLLGEFVRVKVVATGALTPTVKATFR